MTLILPIGDCHVDDEQSLDRFDVASKFIIDKQPDYVILIGDFLTLNCLSAWDKDKRKRMEGKRYSKEIEAGNEALDRLLAEVKEYNKQKKKNKERQYRPHLVYIEGNHEERLSRYLEYDPTFDGHVGIEKDLKLKERGFAFIPYREYYYVDKVGFTHIPFNKTAPISGVDITRKAQAVTVNSVVYGHCFSEDTELLTTEGWKGLDYLRNNPDSLVATMNREDKSLEFQYYSNLYEYDNYDKVVHFYNQQTLDHLVTEDHGMVYETKNGSLYYPKAKNWKQSGYARVSGTLKSYTGIPYSNNEIRLMVWCHADGSLEGGKYWRFNIRKERKQSRLKALLKEMMIDYTQSPNGAIYIGKLPDFYTKDFQEHLIYATIEQSRIIINEWAETDGTNYSPMKQVQLSTSRKEVADSIQMMCVLTGHKSNISLKKEGTYVLNIRYGVQRVQVRGEFNKGTIPYKGKVFCVSVPNGTLVARRNGRVLITQNTHEQHLSHVHKEGMPHLQDTYNCGCYFDKKEDYVHGRVTNYWRGLSLLHVWKPGRFDTESWSLGRLERKYDQ